MRHLGARQKNPARVTGKNGFRSRKVNIMEKFLAGMLMTMLIACMFIVLPIIVALFAGFGAWAAGLVFEDTIRAGLKAIGLNLDGLSMFQIGVTFGFIGSFLRPIIPSGSNSSK
jgi:hypothetical protein